MAFNIIYPTQMSINAPTFAEAVKIYIKNNREMNIDNLIIQDKMKQQRKANISYYKHNNKNKFKVKLYPYESDNIMFNNMPIIIPVPNPGVKLIGTRFPYGTIIKAGCNFPNGTVIQEGTYMNDTTVILNGTILPLGTIFPNNTLIAPGTIIPVGAIPREGLRINAKYIFDSTRSYNTTISTAIFGLGTILPEKLFLPYGTVIVNGTEFSGSISDGTIIPNGFLFTQNSVLPLKTLFQNGSILNKTTVLEMGTVFELGCDIKPSTNFPLNTVLQSGINLPNGTIIDNITTNITNNYKTNLTSSTLPSGYNIPDFTNIPIGFVFKDGSIFKTGSIFTNGSTLTPGCIFKSNLLPEPRMPLGMPPGMPPGMPQMIRMKQMPYQQMPYQQMPYQQMPYHY